MIEITGLTKRQKQIMDLLWGCETEQEAVDLIRSLPSKQDQLDGAGLIRIAIWAVLEEQGELDVYEDAAKAAIAAAMR